MLSMIPAALTKIIPAAAAPAPAPASEETVQAMQDAVQRFAEAAQAAADVAKAAAGGGQPAPAEEASTGFSFNNLDFDTVMMLVQQYGIPVVKALVILFVAFLLASWARRVILNGLTRAKIDVTLGKFISNAAKWGLLVLAVLMVLSVFGIQTASFAVVIGALGLAIGLAFQGTLSNIAAGMMLLIFRPFKVGDVVNIADTLCKVDEIQLFFTTVDTFDNRRLIIPNTNIFGETIENITFHPKRRADVSVGVAYSASVEETRKALLDAVERVELRLKGEDHMVVIDGFGDSSVNWQVRVWTPTPDWLACRQEVIQRIKEALDDANINIPFPQRDVYLFRQNKN